MPKKLPQATGRGTCPFRVAKVRRMKDRRVFYIGLSFLRTERKEDPLYHVLNDYSVWHCNY